MCLEMLTNGDPPPGTHHEDLSGAVKGADQPQIDDETPVYLHEIRLRQPCGKSRQGHPAFQVLLIVQYDTDMIAGCLYVTDLVKIHPLVEGLALAQHKGIVPIGCRFLFARGQCRKAVQTASPVDRSGKTVE